MTTVIDLDILCRNPGLLLLCIVIVSDIRTLFNPSSSSLEAHIIINGNVDVRGYGVDSSSPPQQYAH
jgi:hypothetical protein